MKSKILALSKNEEFKKLLTQKKISNKYFTIFSSSIVGKFILVGFTWSFCYHLLNGLRHLFWDMGYGYEIKTANFSGIFVLTSSFLLTIILWVVS